MHTVTYENLPNPYRASTGRPLTRFVCSCGSQSRWYVHPKNASTAAANHVNVWSQEDAND